jgi:hypothetical protein
MAGRETDKTYATEQRLNALISRLGILTDTTQFTANTAAALPLCNTYTIPGGTANVGTIYRGRTGGTGTWGSTQQQLTLQQFIGNSSVNQLNVAAAAFAASAPVDWDLWFEYMITVTGASGKCRTRMVLAMSVNNAAANNSNGVIAVRRAVSVNIDTTVSHTISIEALWASTTGSPTLTGDGVSYERLGP